MTASNSEVIKAFAVQAINYSSRDIIGEFVDELFSATDSQYREVIEDHVERFANETIALIPDLGNPEFRFTLYKVTEMLLMSAV
jgi:hypothetical protein